jgi:glycerol-3-phosphate dehydrogenase
VELAGAGKNVYALAAGIASGMGFENNARAGGSSSFMSEFVI